MEHLYKQPIKACAPIVKEFYANLNEKFRNDIYIWGKKVHLNVNEIHKAYNLGLVEDEAFIALREGNYKAILSSLIDDIMS